MSALFNNSNSGVRIWVEGLLSAGAFTVVCRERFPTIPNQSFVPIIVLGMANESQSFLYMNAAGAVLVGYNWNSAQTAVGSYTAGAWGGFALVGSGSTLTGFSGAAKGSVTQVASGIRSLLFGMNYQSGASNARLADVRVFNAALSDAQVAAELASATPVLTGSLVGDFPLATAYAARSSASGWPNTATAHNAHGNPSVSFSGDSPSYAAVGPAPTIAITSATISGRTITASGTLTSDAGSPSVQLSGFGPATLQPVSAVVTGSAWTATIVATAPGTISVTATVTDANGSASASRGSISAAGFLGTFYVPSYYNPASLIVTPSAVNLAVGADPQRFVVTDDQGTIADGASISYAPSVVGPTTSGADGSFTVLGFPPGSVTVTASLTIPQAGATTKTVTGTATVVSEVASAPVINTVSLPDAVVSLDYSHALDISDASTVTIVGPAWLTVSKIGDTFTLVGRSPALASDVSVRVVASSDAGTVSKTFTFKVVALAITLRPLRNGTVGEAYSYNVGDGGGVFSATGLPPGLSMSPTGMISGIPTVSGSFEIEVTEVLPGGAVLVLLYTMAINEPVKTYPAFVFDEVVSVNKYTDLIPTSHR